MALDFVTPFIDPGCPYHLSPVSFLQKNDYKQISKSGIASKDNMSEAPVFLRLFSPSFLKVCPRCKNTAVLSSRVRVHTSTGTCSSI